MRLSEKLSAGTIPTMVLSVIKSEDMYDCKIDKMLEVWSDNVFSLKGGRLYPILYAWKKRICW